MSLAVGIDLGTTNSVIAYINASGQPVVIPDEAGDSITPSVISFSSFPPVVGRIAKERQADGEEDVASFFKRNMGDPNFILNFRGADYTATQLSALVLGKLKEYAEQHLKQMITEVVITVPAYFNNAQREATIEAGQLARLRALQIINEPTSAALSYRLHESAKPQTVLVYDLGGGTFDVSLVEISRNDLKVQATAGDHNLGGKDWDDCLVSYLADRFSERHGQCPLDDVAFRNEILARAEIAKKSLSKLSAVRVDVTHGGLQERVEITRDKFNELTRDLMERTQILCEQVLEEKGMNWSHLSGVLLVGGSTRMPMVHDYVTRMSGKHQMKGGNEDEAVALGAAVQAGIILADRQPSSQAFFLPGKKAIVDVTAHTLGVIAESADHERFLNSFVVKRNTALPAQGTREYQIVTGSDGRAECIVYVSEGESDDPDQVTLRGKYVCRGIVKARGGPGTIQVEIAYDKNGTIQVRARERGGDLFEVVPEPVGDSSWLSKSPRELQSFDPSNLRLVVTPPAFDNIGGILNSLSLPFQDYDQQAEADILFLNCGTARHPSGDELRAFVRNGGCLYASDLTDGIIAEAFPDLFHFGGHHGEQGQHSSEVVDPSLRTALGSKVQITFDLPGWAVLESVARDARVLLRSVSTKMPLMAVADYGEGTIFYTCFHNHSQANGTEESLLQLLVLKQISAVTRLPIEVVSRGRGLAINT